MSDPWIGILETLRLSRTEREVLKRYKSDPEGRSFLPLADVLRTHKLVNESTELLSQGVARHPGFTVARVVLVRELTQKGLIAEAWRILEESPVPLKDNVLAQKLRFKLAILLKMAPIAEATLQHMNLHQMLDTETKKLGETFKKSGFEAVYSELVKEMARKGIELVLPQKPVIQQKKTEFIEDEVTTAGTKTDLLPQINGASSLGSFEDDEDRLRAIASFHVVPLDEIFNPNESTTLAQGSKSSGGMELDSTTLADIYAKQGHYGKSLAIYRRLLRLSPNNDLIKQKVAEIAKLEREQKEEDLSIDPSVVDRMETVGIIDKQMTFYQSLLNKI